MIVIIAIVSGSREPIAWKSALCSESIGSSRAPARARRLHHHRAGAHQRLLVGEGDRASGRDRGEGRLEARRADDRRDDEVRLAQRRLADRLGAGRGLDARPRQRRLELGVGCRIGDRRKSAPSSMARLASAAPSLPAATDTTENCPGAAAITWAQEPPIDPVAPRMASRLGAVARFGAVAGRRSMSSAALTIGTVRLR